MVAKGIIKVLLYFAPFLKQTISSIYKANTAIFENYNHRAKIMLIILVLIYIAIFFF